MLIKYTGKNKFIFIANTKCASTSIESSEIADVADIKLINSNIGKHMSIGKVCEKFDFIFKEYKTQGFFKFGIIRNPLDWVVSWFNFRSRTQLKEPSHPNHENYTGEMTFSEFWHSNKNKHFLKPQYQSFFAKGKNIQLDYIMLHEKLLDHIAVVETVLSLNSLTIQNKNKSSVKRIKSKDIKNDIRNEIKQKYDLDYELINNLEKFNSKRYDLF